MYGIWFPVALYEWYEKDPNSIIDEEFRKLVRDFDEKLLPFMKFSSIIELDAFIHFIREC